MSVTIRIPTVKYLKDLLDLIGDTQHDITVSVDRWSDELELDQLTTTQSSQQVIQLNTNSRKQLEQLRAHLRGE